MIANRTKLMTEGPVWKKMVSFALPVFIGQLFQQLYNTADSLIVGNFLDSNSLAAVTSSGNLIFLINSFVMGLSMGAGIVLANYIGAQDKDKTEKAVHTFVALSIAAGIFLTVVGITAAPLLLRLMDTPEEVLPYSITYFRWVFAGSLGLSLYNTFRGILEASGDSTRPLYFLILSSVLNILLDLLLIGVFHFGVASAAIATAISQLTSALLCMRLLLRTTEAYRLRIRKIGFNMPLLTQIIRYGIPSGVQNSVIGFANVIVQSFINRFGAMAMAGHGAYSKIEGFAFLPITSFTMAMTTFIAQNIGARQFNRVKKGSAFGTVCAVVLAELTGILVYLLAPVLIGAFDSTPEAVAFGTARAQTCSIFFGLLAYSHSMSAVLRGEGRPTVPMMIMLACWCVIRVTILAVWGNINHTIITVNWVYPITWSCSTVAFTLYYILANPLKKIVKKSGIQQPGAKLSK